MMIETNKFYNVHGKEPRGFGKWMFVGPERQIAMTPNPMKYSEAKRWLVRELKGLGLINRNVTWQVAP